MTNIKLKVKLGAYTKGTIPKLPDNLVKDVPNDGKEYVRKYGEWVELSSLDLGQIIRLPEDSGLNLIEKIIDGKSIYELSIRQKVIKETEFRDAENDTTYYLVNEKPELFINGGTAYNSDEDMGDIIGQIVSGGSSISTFTLGLLPINSKGVYNGN